MTPAEVRTARDKLGLTGEQLGLMLGYSPKRGKQAVSELEHWKPLKGPYLRLLRAYLDSYRPDDWPQK